MAETWVKRWGYEMSAQAVRPGVYRLKAGGYLVTVTLMNPRTRRRQTTQQVLPKMMLAEAVGEREALKLDLRARQLGRVKQRMRFSAFAASLFEEKVTAGEIESAAGRDKWRVALEKHILPRFGDLFCHELTGQDLIAWRNELAKKVKADRIAASTANTWFSVLSVITAAMKSRLHLIEDPSDHLKMFDLTRRPTYTREKPNALTVEQARAFLAEMMRTHPQHYAMAYLGFVTGKRPSSLRTLRRKGTECDVNWQTGEVVFRRSHTLGDEMMVGTKTTVEEVVHLPPEALHVLRQHVALIEHPPIGKWNKPPLWWRKPMAESDLLFPARGGGPRSRSVLDKPFKAIAKPADFAKTHFEDGTVCWDAGVDIAPTLLYSLAHGLPRPESFEDAQANLAAMKGPVTLQRLRKLLGITQARAAALAKLTQPSIVRIEREPDPKVSTLRTHLNALGLELVLSAVKDGRRVQIDLRGGKPKEAPTPKRASSKKKGTSRRQAEAQT